MRFAQKVRKKIKQQTAEFYSLRSMLGYDWALFLLLLGGREAGKSYSVTKFYVRQWKIYGRPFYWMRLTDASQEKLLKNNAEKLIDADIRRKYDIDLFFGGHDHVYTRSFLMTDDDKFL